MITIERNTALLLLVWLTGCNGARGGSAGPETPAPDPVAAAVARCEAAIEGVEAALPANRAAIFAEGCADLFGQLVCSEAVRLSPAAAPELRQPMIVAACQHAYCDLLPSPRPELCEMSTTRATPSELTAAWGPFLADVLLLELLDEGATELAQRLAELYASVLFGTSEEPAAPGEPADPAAPPACQLVLGMSGGPGGYRLGASRDNESFGPWDLPLRPDQGDVEGLLESALAESGGCAATLEIGPDVDADLVAMLTDVLNAAGVDRVTVSPAP